jgi:hypothetical protein
VTLFHTQTKPFCSSWPQVGQTGEAKALPHTKSNGRGGAATAPR